MTEPGTESDDGPLEGVVPAVTDDPPIGLAFPGSDDPAEHGHDDEDAPDGSVTDAEPMPGG